MGIIDDFINDNKKVRTIKIELTEDGMNFSITGFNHSEAIGAMEMAKYSILKEGHKKTTKVK
jgi:hypothetical protein